MFVLLALLVIAGLSAGIVRGSPSSADESLDPQTQEYVLSLVTRWLYEEDPHLEIEEEIRALSVEEARLSLLFNYTILPRFSRRRSETLYRVTQSAAIPAGFDEESSL